jgi:hypothetical protein
MHSIEILSQKIKVAGREDLALAVQVVGTLSALPAHPARWAGLPGVRLVPHSSNTEPAGSATHAGLRIHDTPTPKKATARVAFVARYGGGGGNMLGPAGLTPRVARGWPLGRPVSRCAKTANPQAVGGAAGVSHPRPRPTTKKATARVAFSLLVGVVGNRIGVGRRLAPGSTCLAHR